MDSQKIISSLQNPIVKDMVRLKEKSRARTLAQKFVVEGVRELQLAIDAGYEIIAWYYQAQICSKETLLKIQKSFNDRQQYPISPIQLSASVYEKIAQRNTTEGVIALAKPKLHRLSDLSFKNKNPLILVAEAPEKPGNIGALLRTADAANLDAVIIANPKSDLYNPNIIRSSVGGAFTVPVAMGSSTEVLEYLQGIKANVYAAALQASKHYREVSYIGPTAIVVGTEATGLEALWLESSNQNIRIPMRGAIDSMNVSVAAGILIFEALRQRDLL